MKEIWKDIEGYEGLYQISNLGNVKSLHRIANIPNGHRKVKERILKQTENRGYRAVIISKEKTRKEFSAHRLVAFHFIPNPENKPEVNHIDGNKSNNKVENLEWVTPSENIRHSYAVGLARNDGENHPASKLTEYDVRVIKQMLKDGMRVCDIHKKFSSIISRYAIKDIKSGKSWKNIKL